MAETLGGIQVAMSPSQSSYFAGESFSVTITFTNTNDPSTSSYDQPPLAFSPSHRRSAHSVVYPPTTPNTPVTALYASPAKPNGPISSSSSSYLVPKRKGLIGKGKQKEEISLEDFQNTPFEKRLSGVPESKRKHSSKSLSVSGYLPDVVIKLPGELILNGRPSKIETGHDSSVTSAPDSATEYSPASALRQPSASRANSQPGIPKSHPHARKQSISESQSQVHDVYPNSGATSYTLSLDPISESAGPPQRASPDPVHPGRSESNSVLPFDPFSARDEQRANNRRRSSLGYGSPPSVSPTSPSPRQPPRSALSSTFSPPGTELLFWAYAKLTGTVELDHSVVPIEEIELLRSKLHSGGAVGGGRLEVGGSSHRRSASGSFISSFFMSPQPPSSPPPPSRVSSPSIMSSLFSSSPRPDSSANGGSGRLHGGFGGAVEDPSSMPVLETQPSMLVVDLNLAPGESRRYVYSLSLPSVLPPTFRGKALKLSYNLVVGTSSQTSNTILPQTPSRMDRNQRSRVFRVPIRIYNNVDVGRPQRPYDLLWPIARRRERPAPANVREIRVGALTPSRKPSNSKVAGEDALLDLSEYARNLLHGAARSENPPRGLADDDDFGNDRSRCREAVEVLTRNPKKVSYDIAKDGEQVAVLTFVKSAYRLGETILGVVDLNIQSGRTKVLKFSASLEAHEVLPPSISTHASRSNLKRVYSEYLCSLSNDTCRSSFSLDIPADGTPAFRLTAHNPDEPAGGLNWKVRMCFLVAVSGSLGEMRSLVRDGPEGEWCTSWKASGELAPQGFVVDGEGAGIASPQPPSGGWVSMFLGSGGGSGDVDTPSAESSSVDVSEKSGRWLPLKLETVECEVPVMVWPGATAFRPVISVFDT